MLTKNKKIIAKLATSCFVVDWGLNGVGYGSFAFYKAKKGGKCRIDNEYMSKDTIKKVICQLIDNAVLIDPPGKKKG